MKTITLLTVFLASGVFAQNTSAQDFVPIPIKERSEVSAFDQTVGAEINELIPLTKVLEKLSRKANFSYTATPAATEKLSSKAFDTSLPNRKLREHLEYIAQSAGVSVTFSGNTAEFYTASETPVARRQVIPTAPPATPAAPVSAWQAPYSGSAAVAARPVAPPYTGRPLGPCPNNWNSDCYVWTFVTKNGSWQQQGLHNPNPQGVIPISGVGSGYYGQGQALGQGLYGLIDCSHVPDNSSCTHGGLKIDGPFSESWLQKIDIYVDGYNVGPASKYNRWPNDANPLPVGPHLVQFVLNGPEKLIVYETDTFIRSTYVMRGEPNRLRLDKNRMENGPFRRWVPHTVPKPETAQQVLRPNRGGGG